MSLIQELDLKPLFGLPNILKENPKFSFFIPYKDWLESCEDVEKDSSEYKIAKDAIQQLEEMNTSNIQFLLFRERFFKFGRALLIIRLKDKGDIVLEVKQNSLNNPDYNSDHSFACFKINGLSIGGLAGWEY